MSDTDGELAILSGRPARAKKIVPAFHASPATEERVLELIRGGTLSAWYGGSHVHRFEEAFRDYHGAAHAVAVNSGTAALHTAIAAAGIGPGDEVIIPSACFFTAATAILQQNAIPILADCSKEDLGLDPGQLPELISPRTRAVMVVHMYGYPAQIGAVCEIAERHGLIVIEDCGQSLGAAIAGRKVGTFGDFGCFSLASPRKHISVGEGGVVLTREPGLGRALRRVANKGKDDGWFTQRTMGYSYAMPEFPAIIGLQGIEDLEQEIARRILAARAYDEVLQGSAIELENVPPEIRHVYFRKLIRLPYELAHLRDWMVTAIEAENVSAKPPHAPLHKIGWIVNRDGYPRGCPYTCGMGREVDYSSLALPVTDHELGRTIDLETGPCLSAGEAAESARVVSKVFEFVHSHLEKAEELAAEYGSYR